MKLSVVIPVYNGAAFIEKSYRQIMRQAIADAELIYVNNHSTDTSVDAIQSLVNKDPRIRLLQQSIPGAAAARNMGIRAARGEYIYVFDVDDEIFPGALKRMMTVLDTYPEVDAVFGKMVKSYQSIEAIEKPQDETHEIHFKDKPHWGLHWFSSLKHVVGPPGFLYKRRVFDRIGLYNEAIRNNEDTALDIKLGMLCNVAFLDTYVYLYYKHDGSTIQTFKRKTPRAFMIWPRLVKEHLPFYLNHEVPLKFKQLLFRQIFLSMAKQICFTGGFMERSKLKQRLLKEVSPLKVPFLISLYLAILVRWPWSGLRKVYGYYLVPYIVNRLTQ